MGDMLLWTGVWLFCFSGLQTTSAKLGSLLAPAFVYVLFLRISTPMLESQADTKFSGSAAYTEYKQRTPMLVGLPQQRAGHKNKVT